MRLTNILVLISLLAAAFAAQAQKFLVIKDTTYYKLVEVDSAYFFANGLDYKQDFDPDTSIYVKKNGVLTLPLSNGKSIDFKDTLAGTNNKAKREYIYNGEYGKLKFYKVTQNMHHFAKHYCIDKRNGERYLEDNFPIYSPSDSYYVYSPEPYITNDSAFILKNYKADTSLLIKFELPFPITLEAIKWVNDHYFLCWMRLSEPMEYKIVTDKYFIVRIKQ